jgi:DNA-3-methyladenine glycosylase
MATTLLENSLIPAEVERLTPLSHAFYDRDVVSVARDLVGKVVVHDTPEGRTGGRIVETEAYEQTEPASHAYERRTTRNEVMYGPPGFAYVYFSYGIHWMLNFVTGPADFAAAVLIRALEPLVGVGLMEARRGTVKRLELTNGPGKLCQALGIGAAEYGLDLTRGTLTVRDAPSLLPVVASPRIGITKAMELPWRFTTESPYVSKRPT